MLITRQGHANPNKASLLSAPGAGERANGERVFKEALQRRPTTCAWLNVQYGLRWVAGVQKRRMIMRRIFELRKPRKAVQSHVRYRFGGLDHCDQSKNPSSEILAQISHQL
jgi:hypothetical protein